MKIKFKIIALAVFSASIAFAQNDSAAVNAATAATPDSAAVNAATATPEKNSLKSMRNKISYDEQMRAIKEAKAKKDSITYHHGLTITANRYHDKRYGNIDDDPVWGGGAGIYYFFRKYYGSHFALQGRIGGIWRYSRWDFDKPDGHGELPSGNTYDLTKNVELKYHNFALDLPVTAKVGTHITPTSFIFLSAAVGLTKPIYEKVKSEGTIDFADPSKELNEELEVLSKQGLNPMPFYTEHTTKNCFYMNDWEVSSWAGLGIDTKYVSVEFQIYLIGGTSNDANHRYHHIGHDSDPTWRLLFDFSLGKLQSETGR